jgi:hypothetical protein
MLSPQIALWLLPRANNQNEPNSPVAPILGPIQLGSNGRSAITREAGTGVASDPRQHSTGIQLENRGLASEVKITD